MLSRYVEGYESLFEMRKKTGLGIEFDWVSKVQMMQEPHHNLTSWLTFFSFFFFGGGAGGGGGVVYEWCLFL